MSHTILDESKIETWKIGECSDWHLQPGEPLYARDGRHAGTFTGHTRWCQLDGCGGVRMMIRWKDGKVTWPCSKGLKIRRDGKVQIR